MKYLTYFDPNIIQALILSEQFNLFVKGVLASRKVVIAKTEVYIDSEIISLRHIGHNSNTKFNKGQFKYLSFIYNKGVDVYLHIALE